MPAASTPYRLNEIQARILARMEAGEELHRAARWFFPGDRRQASWSSARQLEMRGLIEARDPKAEPRIYRLTEFGREALAAYPSAGTGSDMAHSVTMPLVPHNRAILVLTKEEGLWERVRWSGDRFMVEDEESWVLPEEIEAWKEAPHPPIGIGTPGPSQAS